jgi:hypothetical protein
MPELTDTWPPTYKGSFFKQSREVRQIDKQAKRAKVKTAEKKEKQAAKTVVVGCRWPKFDHWSKRHVCVGQLEAAHGTAIGMGGDKDGSRTSRRDLLVVCSLIHLGEYGIERHGRKWEPLTYRGAEGPVAFYKREPAEGKVGEWGEWTLIAVESSPGILERCAVRDVPR